MTKKEDIKLCLDEIGDILQAIATMEEREYSTIVNVGTPDEKEKIASYKETVQDLADVAAVRFLDQLYELLEIDEEMEV
ncbi:MAG: hypothetical protein L0K82_07500 [Pisciglobus halotolerans]|nr:hypothetical protein [Pisciglobus halotolerans]